MKDTVRFGLLALATAFEGATQGARVETMELSGDQSWVAAEVTTVGVLVVKNNSNVVNVPADMTVTVEDIKGTGQVAKTGAGRLVIDDVAETVRLHAQEGKVHFDRSIGVERLSGAAAIHLDASKPETITIGTIGNGDSGVTKWADVRGTAGYPWAAYDWGCAPYYREGAQNALNTVDLGTTCDWPTARFLCLGNYQGDDAVNGSGDNAKGIKKVKEIFIVAKDQPNASLAKPYQWFLGDNYDNFNTYFMRGLTGAIWSQGDFGAQTAWLNDGTTWVDGEAVSGAASYPEGFHVLRARGTNAAGRFSHLGYYPQGMYSGMSYGEIIAFKADVGDAAGAEMSRRLIHKWLGKQSMASVKVDGGRVLVAQGDTVAAAALNLGSCTLTYGDRTVTPTTLNVAEEGTIDVTFGTCGRIEDGTVITLFEANGTLDGADNFLNWTIRATDREYRLEPTVVGNRLCATVWRRGLSIYVK